MEFSSYFAPFQHFSKFKYIFPNILTKYLNFFWKTGKQKQEKEKNKKGKNKKKEKNKSVKSGKNFGKKKQTNAKKQIKNCKKNGKNAGFLQKNVFLIFYKEI